MYTCFRISPFHFVFRLLFSLRLLFHLLFHLLFSSLFFSSLLSSSLFFSSLFFFSLFSCLLTFSSLFFFLPFSFFFFLPSLIMGHTHRRNSNTCQEPGPTEMSDGMRSTNICQKPFILSCLSFSVSLCLSLFLSLCLRVMLCVVLCGVCRCGRGVVWWSWCVFGVCVCSWCVFVCCGTLKKRGKKPCVGSKRPRVYIRNVPVYAGNTRTCFSTCVRGAGAHKDVLNVHMEAFFESTHGRSSPVQFTKKSRT